MLPNENIKEEESKQSVQLEEQSSLLRTSLMQVEQSFEEEKQELVPGNN